MGREWQMHRAFQSAITLHDPDVVIFLGMFVLYVEFEDSNAKLILCVDKRAEKI